MTFKFLKISATVILINFFKLNCRFINYIKNVDSGKQKEIAKKTRESCYQWLKEATTEQERKELVLLHKTDHNACRNKVVEHEL